MMMRTDVVVADTVGSNKNWGKQRPPCPAASGLLQVPPEGPDILPNLQYHPVLETSMLLTFHTQQSHLSTGVPPYPRF